MATQNHTLTIKQENFCLEYVSSGNASDAYRAAYSVANMKPATVNRNAKTLIENNKIITRIAELRAPAIEKAGITYEGHLLTLEKLRIDAAKAGQFGAAINAEVSRGKAAGLYKDRVEIKNEHKHSGTVAIELSEDAKRIIDTVLGRGA